MQGPLNVTLFWRYSVWLLKDWKLLHLISPVRWFCWAGRSKRGSRLALQVAEEEYLIGELRKMEAQKKERARRAQDVQMLITAADASADTQCAKRKATKRRLPLKQGAEPAVSLLPPVKCDITNV